MDTKTSTVNESVRHTLEYKEARELFARKIEVNHYLKEINYELKQLRCLSATTVEVALTDIQEEMLALGRGWMRGGSRKRIPKNGPDGEDMQTSLTLRLVTTQGT